VGANFEKAAYTFIRDLPTSEMTEKERKQWENLRDGKK
jgi:hypothetical protein